MDHVERLTFKGEPPMAKRDVTVTVERVPLKKIKLGHNSRLDIEPESLEGLMQSIKELGLLQPIGVVKKKDHYEIAYGNRRYLACSKLGLHNIPAIVHEENTAWDVDAKNLAENVQRRNISPLEVGRYVSVLEKQGLSQGEVAVRLGAPLSYIKSCVLAFEEVPEEFRKTIAIGATKGAPTPPGTVSITVTKDLINARKAGLISKPQMKKLFEAAAHSTKFKPSQVSNYITAASRGKKNFLESNRRTIKTEVILAQKEFDRLKDKYVDKGAYSSMSAVIKAVISGEIGERIKILN